jgi:hypothetical protein
VNMPPSDSRLWCKVRYVQRDQLEHVSSKYLGRAVAGREVEVPLRYSSAARMHTST